MIGGVWMRRLLLGTCLATLAAPLSGSVAAGKELIIEYVGVFSAAGYKELEQSIVDEFNRQNKGRIMVIASVATDIDQQLPVWVAAGAAPQVVKVDRFMVGSFAGGGVLQPLDDVIKRDKFDMRNMFPAARDEVVYSGKTYALPWNTDGRALYYNTRLFTEAGIDAASPPRTWEQSDLYAKKIDKTTSDGKYTRVGMSPHFGGNWYFLGWLLAAGGDLLDSTNRQVTWNNDAGREALEWMQKRLHDFGSNSVLTSFNSTFSRHAFFGGAMGMVMHGSWWLGELKQFAPDVEFAVAPAPRPSGLEGTPITWSGGHSLAIPSGIKGEEFEAAWQFLRFYSDKWAQVKLGAGSGQIPALRQAAMSPEFNGIDKRMSTFIDLMPYARYRPVIPAGKELWDIYETRLTELLIEDRMPAAAILDETARLGQAALDAGWKRVGR